MSKCVGVIWNCDHVLKQNSKSSKICGFKKFICIQKWLTQNMWHVGEIFNMIITICKRFHSKFSFYEKGSFWQKDFKKQLSLIPSKYIGSLNLNWIHCWKTLSDNYNNMGSRAQNKDIYIIILNVHLKG